MLPWHVKKATWLKRSQFTLNPFLLSKEFKVLAQTKRVNLHLALSLCHLPAVNIVSKVQNMSLHGNSPHPQHPSARHAPPHISHGVNMLLIYQVLCGDEANWWFCHPFISKEGENP